MEVKVSVLINEGLVNKNLKNPETELNVSSDGDRTVEITWTNNEKKCSLKTS